MTLAVSITALLFSLFVLDRALRDVTDLACSYCHRWCIRKDPDGWRHCTHCQHAWKVERPPST